MINFICAATIIVNMSTQPLNKKDKETFERAKVRCKEVYDDCLKKFVKRDVGTYWAICGGKKDE